MAKIRLVADSKLLFKATIFVLSGLAVFLLLNYSSRFFSQDSTETEPILENELDVDKRMVGHVEDHDLSFTWTYHYSRSERNMCSYFNRANKTSFFCVPNYVVVGGPCSGQQRLFKLLQKHQQICDMKDGTDYFSNFRRVDNLGFQDIKAYVELFGDASEALKEDNELIVGDRGHYLVRDYIVPGDTHSQEPRIKILQYLSHINSDIKVFFAVHNPIKMFECCWCTEKKADDNIPDINTVVSSAMRKYKKCHPPSSEGKCNLVLDYLDKPEKCVIAGFTYFFYNSLLGLVQYKNIKIVHLTEITRGTLEERMAEYSQHLGIDPPNEEALKAMLSCLSGGADTCEDVQLDYETKTELMDFYRNSLNEMYSVTSDERFLQYLEY